MHELVCDECGVVVKTVGSSTREEPRLLAAGGVVKGRPSVLTFGYVAVP